MTELKERAKKQRAELEKRMMGEHSDDEEEKEEGQSNTSQSKQSEDSGCSWGMGEFCFSRLSAELSLSHLRSFHCLQLRRLFQRKTRTRRTRSQRSSMRTRRLPT